MTDFSELIPPPWAWSMYFFECLTAFFTGLMAWAFWDELTAAVRLKLQGRRETPPKAPEIGR